MAGINISPEQLAALQEKFPDAKVGTEKVSKRQVQASQNAARLRRGQEKMGEDFSVKKMFQDNADTAISQEHNFHDKLYDHIATLKSRFDSHITTEPVPGERATRSDSKWKQLQPQFHALLDAAHAEVTRSAAAHASGRTEQHFHTANTAFLNAHKLINDATNYLRENTYKNGKMHPILERVTNKYGTEDGVLMGNEDRSNSANGYQQHLQQAAANHGVALRQGVLANPKVNFKAEDPTSAISMATLAAGEQKAQNVAIAREAGKVKQPTADKRNPLMRASAGTLTLGQMQQAQEAASKGEDPKLEKLSDISEIQGTGYRGVGATGYHQIVAAVQRHYEANNPGKSYYDTPMHQGLNYLAKQHIASLPEKEGKQYNPNWKGFNAHKYLAKNAPHLLEPQHDPLIAYAMKNKVGLPGQTATFARSLRQIDPLMEDYAHDIATSAITVDPTDRKKSRAIEFGTAAGTGGTQ